MSRHCFFCRKPLGIEKRAEMFCSLRCRELYGKLRREAPRRKLSEAPRPGPPQALRQRQD
ncbi:MAG: DUF2116 family Zn-ribbon domain-containing protein [SAR324 cluster bacterium]|nr:DUF2116 family Zn-ribbon domain-containing protein [SAR324 cluster bacterium]